MPSIAIMNDTSSMALLQQWVRQRPWLAAGLAGLVGGLGGLTSTFTSSGTITTKVSDGDEHPLRISILNTLDQQPGLCYRELQRALQAANGSLRHHLDVLQVQQAITIVRVNGRTCYFAGRPSQVEVLTGINADPQRAARRLDVGLSVVQRSIVDHIRSDGIPRSQAALSRNLGRSKATVHSAVKVLRRRGILRLDRLDLDDHLKQSMGDEVRMNSTVEPEVSILDHRWNEEF